MSTNDRTSVPAKYMQGELHNHGGATENQLGYIGALMGRKQFRSDEQMQAFCKRYGALVAEGKLTRRKASEVISFLVALPNKADVEAGREPISHAVPAGRYAIRLTEGIVKFYRVDRPDSGRWAGRTFVKVQASDELYLVRNPAEAKLVLAAIERAGVKESSLLYGQELGHCGVCGRTLTDDSSRERGIGPVCADKLGW